MAEIGAGSGLAHAAVLRDTAQRRFRALEVGRGIAAAMVALSHSVSLCAEPRWYGTVPFGGLLINMDVGVDFFFVLSGFIVTFVHYRDFGRPERLPHYVSRRFSRVYPAYWIILSVIIPVYLLVPSFGKPSQHELSSILASYLLLPMPEQPVLGVAWTLTYEIFFYVLLGVTIVLGRRATPLFLVWLIFIVACQVLGLHDYPLSFIGNIYGTEFLLGMVLAILSRRGTMPFPSVLLGLGLILFFAGVFFAPNIQLGGEGVWARLLFGPAAALIIAGCVELERSERLAVPSWLVPLGSASYAIYLTHVVIESAILRGATKLSLGAIDANAMCIILAVFGIIGGLFYHSWIERPVTQFVRRRLP